MIDIKKISTGVKRHTGGITLYGRLELVATLGLGVEQINAMNEPIWNNFRKRVDHDLRVAIWETIYKDVREELIEMRRKTIEVMGPGFTALDDLITKLTPSSNLGVVNGPIGITGSQPSDTQGKSGQ